MTWIRYGSVSHDDGSHGDEQVGDACSVRFVNPKLPGRLVTVYAFPSAPETLDTSHCPHESVILEKLGDNVARYAPMPDEHVWCTHKRDGLGVATLTEFMICEDVDEPGGTEEWCTYEYGDVDTKPIKDLGSAQALSLAWVQLFDADRDIQWDGNPF